MKTRALPQTMRLSAREQAGLIAAFRRGLGLAGLAVIRTPQRIRFAAVGPDGVCAVAPDEMSEARFWCRRAADAERIVASASSKLLRQARDDTRRCTAHPPLAPSQPSGRASDPPTSFPPEADQALMSAAVRFQVALYSNEEVVAEAMAAIARVEEELESLQRTGALKSVNRSYRTYRQDSSARGEKVVSYAGWFAKYKENLVRQLAAALRDY
jgi:hypothetical protein